MYHIINYCTGLNLVLIQSRGWGVIVYDFNIFSPASLESIIVMISIFLDLWVVC